MYGLFISSLVDSYSQLENMIDENEMIEIKSFFIILLFYEFYKVLYRCVDSFVNLYFLLSEQFI